jgi:Mlc titration factor MtfA (ptsG expression regulator)
MSLFNFFKTRRRKRILDRHPIPDDLWSRAWQDHPILHRLDAQDAQRLRDLATVFLAEKKFLPIGGMKIKDYMPVSVAIQAVLPVLNLGLDWLDDFQTICLIPREYQELRRERVGALITEYLDEISGEVTIFGSLILSWKDVEASGWGSGYNVVIHEIAHKLDNSNQMMDGCPYLSEEQDPERWKEVFTAAYKDLEERLNRNPPLDPYAAESPAEFFAVVSEEFFERPLHLQRHYPELYDLLAGFYRQEPAL